MTGCAKDADCDAHQKCVDTVCLKDDGEACSGASECQNSCIDDVCTSKLADGKDCTTDDDCAHTCIDNVCAPASDVGGDCDVDLGMGGAGGAGVLQTSGKALETPWLPRWTMESWSAPTVTGKRPPCRRPRRG